MFLHYNDENLILKRCTKNEIKTIQKIIYILKSKFETVVAISLKSCDKVSSNNYYMKLA